MISVIIYGVVVGSVFIAFRLPLVQIGVAIIIVLAIIVVSMCYTFGQIKEENIIDVLKQTN